jgi:hypothetical protein
MNNLVPASLAANWPLWAVGVIWSLAWKGWALWKAAKRDDKWWFIFLLAVNTLGILEIIYIYVFSKRGAHREHSGV